MWKLYKKIHKHSVAILPFLNQWSYSRDNIEEMWNRLNEKDQLLFKFQMKEFEWMRYLVNQYKGIRLYLLNEDESTLEFSRIRYKR